MSFNTDPSLGPEFIALRDGLIDRLRRQTPWGYKCVFLNCKAFVDWGPLIRISGKDRYFKSKHKAYVGIEPLLGQID